MKGNNRVTTNCTGFLIKSTETQKTDELQPFGREKCNRTEFVFLNIEYEYEINTAMNTNISRGIAIICCPHLKFAKPSS